MCYTILYKRLFITLPSGRFLPLIQAGDNNVYDVDYRGREVRSRSWEVWDLRLDRTQKALPAIDEDGVKAWLQRQYEFAKDSEERVRTEAWAAGMDAKKNFGWYRSFALAGHHTSTTTFGAFKNFFLKGLAEAIPLADYVSLFGPLRLTWWAKNEGETYGHHVNGPTVETEDALNAAWDEAVKSANDGGPWVTHTTGRAHTLNMMSDYLALGLEKKGVVIKVWFADEPYDKYIAGKYPLTLTENKEDGFVFPKKIVQEMSVFKAVNWIRPGLKQLSYEYVR